MSIKYAKRPCERCGWKFATFHVCVAEIDLEAMRAQTAAKEAKERKDAKAKRNQSNRVLTRRSENTIRDAEIVARYSEGKVGQLTLAAEFEVSQTTISKVLREQAALGNVTLRPPGRTISRGA